MREYDLRQADDRHRLNEHYQTVADRIPAYAAAQEELSALCAEQARRAVLKKAGPDRGFSQRALSIEQSMKDMLRQAGFPDDYLELKYTCPDCKDTGYIGSEKCHCFRQAVVDLLYDQSGLRNILDKENFDTFRMDYYPEETDPRLGISPRQNIQNIVARCRDFIEHFDDEHGSLLFYGSTGVGKTFLTNCIARELLDSSHTVIYLSALQLVEILRGRAFGRDTDDEGDDMADYIFDCELLIIDDLGSELSNAFVNSQLFDCINRRLASSASTIISTNLSLEELQNIYSERIFSRLVGNYEMLPVIGDDIRIHRAISR